MDTFLAQGPQEVTIRQCGARFPEQCITEDSGYFFVTLCSCDTDNCNKDLLCDCPWTGLWQCWCQFRLYLKWLINFIEMPMKSMSELDPTYQTTKMMTQTNLTKSTNDDICSVLFRPHRSKMKAFTITLIILGFVSVSKYWSSQTKRFE